MRLEHQVIRPLENAGDQLFVFVMIDLDTRELLWINTTYSPHGDWFKQQFRNAFMDFELYLSLCICDRDSILGPWFKQTMKDFIEMKVLNC